MELPLSEKRMPVAIPAVPKKARPALLAGTGLAMAALLAVIGLALRFHHAEPDAPFEKAYALALGLGDTAHAMKLAEARKGRDSKEFREAERRDNGIRLRPLQDRARELVSVQDWAGAAEAFAALEPLTDPDRLQETTAARQFCESLARAADREKHDDWAGALQIYTGLENSGCPFQEYLQQSVRRVRARLNTPGPR
jgi:hypothetical protein